MISYILKKTLRLVFSFNWLVTVSQPKNFHVTGAMPAGSTEATAAILPEDEGLHSSVHERLIGLREKLSPKPARLNSKLTGENSARNEGRTRPESAGCL